MAGRPSPRFTPPGFVCLPAFCFLQREQKMNRCVAPVLPARVQHLLYRLSTLDATGGQARIQRLSWLASFFQSGRLFI